MCIVATYIMSYNGTEQNENDYHYYILFCIFYTYIGVKELWQDHVKCGLLG